MHIFSLVCGEITPDQLGKTLTHEHIRMDYKCCFVDPTTDAEKEKARDPEIRLDNLGWIRQYPFVFIIILLFRRLYYFIIFRFIVLTRLTQFYCFYALVLISFLNQDNDSYFNI